MATCLIGGDTYTEGTTYCDANGNLFECVNGALVFLHAGCQEIISTTCSYNGVTYGEGATLCDSNNNKFECRSGDLVYLSLCEAAPPVVTLPNCNFAISPTTATVGETVTFTLNCTGWSPTSFEWNFRDGSSVVTGGGAKTHIFTKSGTYYPMVSLSNSAGSASVGGTITISDQPHVPGCTIGTDYGDMELSDGEEWCDIDANSLYKCANGNTTRISSCTGTGTEKPNVDFTVLPVVGEVGQSITFIPEMVGGGTPSTWDWDFGDGSSHATTSGAKTHEYTRAGYYTVVLVASNSYGTDFYTGHVIIGDKPAVTDPCFPCTTACPDTYKCPSTIPSSKPTAKITPSATTGAAPLVVTFKESNVVTGMTSGKIDFGDGIKDSLMMGSIFHTYTVPGTYAVTYTVTNVVGSSTATATITVSQGTTTVTPKTCSPACGTGYKCNTTTGVCDKITAGGASMECEGLNRSGNLDPTCIMEKGNEIYLYGAIGIIAVIVLMKK